MKSLRYDATRATEFFDADRMIDFLAKAIVLTNPLATQTEMASWLLAIDGSIDAVKECDVIRLLERRLLGRVSYHITHCSVADDDVYDNPEIERSAEIGAFICSDSAIRTYDLRSGEPLCERPFVADEGELYDLTGKDRWDIFYAQAVHMGADESVLCFQESYFLVGSRYQGASSTSDSLWDCLAAAMVHSKEGATEIKLSRVAELLPGLTGGVLEPGEQVVSDLSRAVDRYVKKLERQRICSAEQKRTLKLRASPYYLVVFPEIDYVAVLDKSSLNHRYWFFLSSVFGSRPYEHSLKNLEVLHDHIVDRYSLVRYPFRRYSGRVA